MARAATSPELSLFRTNGGWAKLSLFIYTPAVICGARVAVAPATNDQVRQVAYGSVTGTIGDVLADMTMLVGTTPGGWDKGFCRVRIVDGTYIYIGETSEIVWAIGQYLTIVADWEIWLRKLSFLGGAYNLDNEIPYVAQYTDPVPEPVLGPYLAVIKLTAGSAALAMNAGSSWAPGGTIATYAWSAKGPAAVTFSNATAANPTLTFTAAGTYRIACAVSTSTQTNTGYRLVHVYSDAAPLAGGFVPGKIDVSRDAGGAFTVDLYDPAVLAGVRPRALVALVAEDHYGDTIQSIGPIPGYEPVVALGRISGESIAWSPEQSRVTFTVQGPPGQLQVTPNWPFTLMHTNAVKPGSSPLPADWLHMPGLTVDRALWCWANWRSTMSRCMDVLPTGDTRQEFSASGNLGGSWEQIRAFVDQIGATPTCDRYGRLFVQIDPNLLAIADRAAIPTVMEISKADWSEEIILERREYAVTGLLQTAGYYFNGATFDTMLSAAPGNALGIRGNTQTKNNLLFSSQAQANELTGRLLMRANNEYPTATISLAANNRLIDVAPQQYVTLTLAAGDTPLGVSFTAKKFIPRRVTYTYDPESGMFTGALECEGETFDGPAVTVTAPSVPKTNIVGGGTTKPNLTFPWPPINFGPPVVTQPPVTPPPVTAPGSGCGDVGAPTNGPWDTWIRGTHTNNAPSSYGLLDCILRAATATNGSKYRINGKFYSRATANDPWVETLDDNFYNLYGIDINAVRAALGVKDALGADPHFRGGSLNTIAATQIQAVELSFGTSGTVNMGSALTATLQAPQAGLGTVGTILSYSFLNVVTTPTLYSVMNATFTTGGYSAYGNKYHDATVDLIFAAGSSGSYKIKARASAFSNFLGVQLVYQNGINYGSPEIPITAIITDVNVLEGEFTLTFTNWPAGRVVRLINHISWLNGADRTIIYRLDVWAEPVPTKRIDIDSLTLYNVCPVV